MLISGGKKPIFLPVNMGAKHVFITMLKLDWLIASFAVNNKTLNEELFQVESRWSTLFPLTKASTPSPINLHPIFTSLGITATRSLSPLLSTTSLYPSSEPNPPYSFKSSPLSFSHQNGIYCHDNRCTYTSTLAQSYLHLLNTTNG